MACGFTSHPVRSSVVGTAEVAEGEYEAARQVALAVLSTLKRQLGNLDGVTAWLTLIDTIPIQGWYILAEYDWYIRVPILTVVEAEVEIDGMLMWGNASHD